MLFLFVIIVYLVERFLFIWVALYKVIKALKEIVKVQIYRKDRSLLIF